MKKENIRHMYDGMCLLDREKEEMYREIIEKVRKRKRSIKVPALLCGAALVLFLLSLPSFRSFAEEKIRMFSYFLLYGDSIFEAELEEKNIPSPEAMGPSVYKSLSEAEKAFGLSFLRSDDPSAESIPSGLFYQPIMISDEKAEKHFAGMSFADYAYAAGDIQNVSVSADPSKAFMNSISFSPGKEYASPIALQIRIITDKDLYESTFPKGTDFSDPRYGIQENQAETYFFYPLLIPKP